jgi:hypothetical protein
MVLPVRQERMAYEATESLTIAQELKMNIGALLDLFQLIGCFFDKIINTPKIDPKDIPFSTPIHGMYALPSVREFLKNLHNENLMRFNHKEDSTIEYKIEVDFFSKMIIKARQTNGATIQTKQMLYIDKKGEEVSKHFYFAQENHTLSLVKNPEQLEKVSQALDFLDIDSFHGLEYVTSKGENKTLAILKNPDFKLSERLIKHRKNMNLEF